MNDLDLLREYEPVLRFTEGELFFPCAVEGYVQHCSLLPRTRDSEAQPIVPVGALDVEMLATEGEKDPGRVLCLRLVDEPLKGRAYRQWLSRPNKPVFRTSGRLARVGLTARFVDSLFELSLLLRGTVPGGTAAAAEQKYRSSFEKDPEYVYYGRVVKGGSYTVLNYLFFYYMNDWRSTFSGVNDHEADWEQIFIFLSEKDGGGYEPAWLAYASHDFHGDDSRRRWDDPELTFEGSHPVVFPGAGSHSAYFEAGEYLTSVELPPARPLLEAIRMARQIWREVLRQGEPEIAAQVEALLRIPFVDYARGDGRSIGPGQPLQWSPAVIDDKTPWVNEYRGLWGLDTHDPFQGELAPSGPKYQRDGSVRQSWYDPIGWAGLGKVAPPNDAPGTLGLRISDLETELQQVDDRLRELDATLPGVELEVRSLRTAAYLRTLWQRREAELEAQEAERNSMRARQVELNDTLRQCRLLKTALDQGETGDPESHLRHKRVPQTQNEIQRSRLAEIWAGLSIAVLLLGGVAVLLLARENWAVALFLVVASVVVVENALHRALEKLLLNVTIVLAVATAAVLVYRFFWPLSLVVVVVIALVILRDNLRELRGS
jgi:hypothetical protein